MVFKVLNVSWPRNWTKNFECFSFDDCLDMKSRNDSCPQCSVIKNKKREQKVSNVERLNHHFGPIYTTLEEFEKGSLQSVCSAGWKLNALLWKRIKYFPLKAKRNHYRSAAITGYHWICVWGRQIKWLTHWHLELFAKIVLFFYILVVLKLDRGQISFRLVENALVARELAVLATRIAFKTFWPRHAQK